MAIEILTDVLSQRILWDDFAQWLKREEKSVLDLFTDVPCNQGDFIVYFINLLHDDAASIIEKSRSGVSSAKKTTLCTPPESKNSASITSDKRRNEHVPVRWKNNKHNSSYSGADSNKSSFNFSGNRSFYSKSVDIDSVNKSNSKRETSSKGETKPSDFLVTPDKTRASNNLEVHKEELFLNNCPLSPISNELNSLKIPQTAPSTNELDSPNNRIFQKDGRRPGSNKKRMSVGRATSSPCNNSFNISEHSFPAINSSTKANSSQTRRIKPTRLADSFDRSRSFENNSGTCFGHVTRPSEPSTPFKEEVVHDDNNFLDIRELLRIEKQKLQQSQQFSPAVSQTSYSSPITPKPDAVISAKELLILSNIYSLLWNTNQISNIIAELNFVLSLLTVQEKTLCPSDKEVYNPVYFKSIHECVYFATSVLNQQRHLISVLDNTSVKLLLDNSRVASFTPNLQEHIQAVYEERRNSKNIPYTVLTEFAGNVSFQSDTDNRENFPTDKAFVTFRKQRDAFYDILTLWETNHASPGWSFGAALGAQVRSLLNINNEPANFIHLTRLFRCQLLGSCLKSGSLAEEEINDETVEVLKILKEGNPEKYTRLLERLVTPFKSTKSNTLPEFSGKQEFYRDFIVCGANAMFNCHLIDSLWHEILNLNASQFTASEVEDGAACVDLDTRQTFISCVRDLQLLAKFLGFVVFLPYQTSKNMSEPLAVSQSLLRMKVQPQIDVLSCLKASIHSRNFLLTAPWIVQYLSMVDNVSLHLTYYKDILNLLYSIYQALPKNKSISLFGRTLLKVSLGWLFELPQFPEDSFYVWYLNREKNGVAVEDPFDNSGPTGVDDLDIVNWQCLQAVCPSLESVKWRLLSENSSVSNVVAPRHITPLPVATEPNAPSTSAKQLQLQLEENFLQGQPRSVRSTIEFVSQRIASSCVKYICSKPLQEVKERGLKPITEAFDPENKDLAGRLVTSESFRCSMELKAVCQEMVLKFCHSKCSAVLPLLFAEETSKIVTETCVEIAVRMSVDKVNLWINSHITPGLFVKDFQSEIQRLCKTGNSCLNKLSNVLPSGWRDVPENEDALPTPETIRRLRELMWRVMNKEVVSDASVLSVLNAVRFTLRHRKDLVPSAERVLGSMSVDFILALITHQPQMIKTDFLEGFLEVWQTPEVSSSKCFDRIVCSRNVIFLSQSFQKSKTWAAYAKLLAFILANELVPYKQFETQCVSLLQEEWPSDTLKLIASCLEEVVSICKPQMKNADEMFVLLLELVSELCQDMGSLDIDF